MENIINTKKKYLFIVRTGFQLLQAFHIRRKMLSEESADIFLSSDRFKDGYVDRLSSYFDSVVYLGNVYPNGLEKYKYFMFPEKALQQRGVFSLEDYSDVFFYNPGWVFYYVRKYDRIKKKHIKWHVLQDGISNYFWNYEKDYYIFDGYSDKVWQRFLKYIDHKIIRIGLKDFDEYIWKPEIKLKDKKTHTIRVEGIDCNDQTYVSELNKVFGYTPQKLNGKIIFVDSMHGVYDDDYEMSFIKGLGEKYGKNNILLFMHPGEKEETYESIRDDVTIIRNKVPWELICINSMVSDKVVLGAYSSAIIMPFILCKNNYPKAFSISKLMDIAKANQNYLSVIELSNRLFSMVEEQSSSFCFLKSPEDIVI